MRRARRRLRERVSALLRVARLHRFRGLNFLLLLLVVFSCTSGARLDVESTASAASTELGASELALAQRRSLRSVFYRNNDMPLPPTAMELRRLERRLVTAPPVEVDELRALYGEDSEMLVYATRDSDKDGVFDYRISEYRGKFHEGDIDVDGDGIRNIYDVAPYDPRVGGVDRNGDGIPDKPGSFADRDGDGIPDHLDWSRRKPEPLPELQASLFRDFGVIVVERTARVTPELVHAIDDTLRYVIREPLPTLKTIAIEDQLLIDPDLGDNGFMLAQTQTLTICMNSLEGAAPIVLLGLLVHEVGHAWQLAQDFDESNLAAENVKMHFPPGRFARSLERYGWQVDRTTLDSGSGFGHVLYWPHFYATSPRYLYRGSSPNEWATWFEDVQRESGPEFLRNSPAVTWGMIGPYSLTSPWEWHADHLMAALYNRIDRGLNEHENRVYRNISGLLREQMLTAIQAQWTRFDYRNAVGTSIDRELGRRFALTDQEVADLVHRYVISLADFPMLSQAIALETSTHQPVGGVVSKLFASPTGAELGAAWTELMHEPLRERPDIHALIELTLSPWDTLDYSGDAGQASGEGRAKPKPESVPNPDAEGEPEPAGEGDAAELPPDSPDPIDAELPGPPEPIEPSPDPRTATGSARGGAGRVGGYATDEVPPHSDARVNPDLLSGAGDPELEDELSQLDPELEPVEDDPDAAKVIDPVLRLLEQISGVDSAPSP